MFQPKYTDEQIIADFRSGGPACDKAWKFIFKNWLPRVVQFIATKGGDRLDVLDSFGEVAIRFQRNVCKPDFVVKHELFAYFRESVYHEWIRWKIREAKKPKEPLDMEKRVGDPVESVEYEIAQTEFTEAVRDSLSLIGERCKKLLLLFYQQFSMKEIAHEMGFAGGEQVAKNEKSKCWSRYLAHLRERPEILQHLKNMR